MVSDRNADFPFLSQIPSSYTKLFINFWGQAAPGAWEHYVKSDFRKQFWHGLAPNRFEEYIETVKCQWRFLPESMKMTLAAMFAKTGRIPSQFASSQIAEVDLRKYAHCEWPSLRDIERMFKKEFELKLLNREDSSLYQVSENLAPHKCATRLIISTRLKNLSYFHILNESSPFLLIDDAGNTVFPNNWDLVCGEDLEKAVQLLKRIVIKFENSVARVPKIESAH